MDSKAVDSFRGQRLPQELPERILPLLSRGNRVIPIGLRLPLFLRQRHFGVAHHHGRRDFNGKVEEVGVLSRKVFVEILHGTELDVSVERIDIHLFLRQPCKRLELFDREPVLRVPGHRSRAVLDTFHQIRG